MTPDERLQRLQRALGLLQEGRAGEAAELCASVREAMPSDPDPWRLMGLIKKAQMQLEGAEADLRESLRLQPENHETLNSLGGVLMQRKRHEDAVQFFRKALALAPDYHHAALNLATTLAETDALDEAIAIAEAWEARVPAAATRFEAVRGLALKRMGRLDDAETVFRAAIAKSPDFGRARFGLAGVLADQERYEDAVAELDAGQPAPGDAARWHILRKNALVGAGRIDEAVEAIQAAVDADPRDSDALRDAAQLYYMTGRPDDAVQLFETALSNVGEDRAILIKYIDVLRQMERNDDAVAAVARCEATHGRSPNVASFAAQVHIARGDAAAALDYAEEYARATPDRPDLHHPLAQAQMMAERPAEALRTIEAAMTAAPDDQIWLGMFATALRQLGDPYYAELCDYEAFVRPYEVGCPPGYESAPAFVEAFRQNLYRRHHFSARPLNQTLRGGSQATLETMNVRDPELRAYYTALDEPIREYIAAMPDNPFHPLSRRRSEGYRIAGAWTARLFDDGYHTNHVHNMGWISSAFYVDVPDGVAASPDREGWIKFGQPPFNAPGADEPEKWFTPRPGWLVLFPSYFWHGTERFHAPTPRMTAPFDVVPDP